jgi:hypothetical protein
MAKPMTHAEWQVWIANEWGKAAEAARAQKEWVGLTAEEINALYIQHHNQFGECLSGDWGYERDIEAKLKEKNHAG